MKKILIATGTCDKFSYCENPVFGAILNQDFKDFDLLIVDNSSSKEYYHHLKQRYATVLHLDRPKYFRDAVGQVRQFICNYAITNGYEYVMMVDADMLIEKDTLTKLLSHKKEFVSAVIGYLHNQKGETTIFTEDKARASKLPGFPALKPVLYAELDDNLTEIAACGLSACLIKTSVLIGLNFFVSHKSMAFMEDIVLCRDLRSKGVRLFVDESANTLHLHVKMDERNLRSISQ